MGRLCNIESTEYATDYQKAYGISDDVLAFLSMHQEHLVRFDRMPECEGIDTVLKDPVDLKMAYLKQTGAPDLFSEPVLDKVAVDFRVIANCMLMALGFAPIAFKDISEAKDEYYVAIKELTRANTPRDEGRMANLMLAAERESRST